MKPIKVNTRIIAKLKPCTSRVNNWKQHYGKKTFDLVDFLDLPKITHSDKLWIALRLMPRHLVEVFAIDCACKAATAAANAAAANAANAAAVDARKTEQQRQIEALVWLLTK